jgi:hypothetical protein
MLRKKQIEYNRAKSEMLKDVERIEAAKRKAITDKRAEEERKLHLMKQERNEFVMHELTRKEQHIEDMKKYSAELESQDINKDPKAAPKKEYKTKIIF